MSDFEAVLLPDEEKRELCESLLAEFGGRVARHSRDKGELHHSCVIPGAHPGGDRHPSASINYKKLTFNCFSCGSSGGLLFWISRCRGEDAQGVRDWLGAATGTGGQVQDLGRFLEILEAIAAPSSKPTPMPRMDAATIEPWLGEHHPYLTRRRGVPEETLKEFRIGYAPDYPVGGGRTQERIVIPQFWRGHLVGWQARAIHPLDEPKYRFSTDFPRDRTLYHHHDGQDTVIVESPLSVLRHHHHQLITATFGAKVTDAQLRLLQRHRRVVLWFDNDKAGWEATERVGEELLDYCEVWAVQTEIEGDPADLDDGLVDQLVDEAVPFSIWSQPRLAN